MSAPARVPEDVKWRNVGRQLGRERCCLDLMKGTPQDPAALVLDLGCHPAWIEGMRLGYAETLAARERDPMQVAMGGNE